MLLGYTVDNAYESRFVNAKWDNDIEKKLKDGNATSYGTFGAGKTNGLIRYGVGSNQTVVKTWDGAVTLFANKNGDGGDTIKLYSYDKDGKCNINSSFSPD